MMTPPQFDRSYAQSLNPQQLQAVHSVDGPILLLAVPGSGKTTVLVTRLGYMLLCRQIPARHILTMTYTVAATVQMRQRFCAAFGEALASELEFCTINSLCAQIILRYARTRGRGRPFDLIENDAAARLVAELYQQLHGESPTESTVKEIRTGITYIKNMMLSSRQIRQLDLGIPKLAELYDRYCQSLKQQSLMDYDDQMGYALTILSEFPEILSEFQKRYRYLCVDEAQDTSRIQHEIIRLLASRHHNLFLVGDEDQSIYGFRAAYPQALLDFEQDYPGARILLMEHNYRSSQSIVSAANLFVARNRFRREKTIRPTRDAGEPIHRIHTVNRIAQYQFLFALGKTCPKDTAVLYRNNDSALPLIDLFERHGIPYHCRSYEDSFFTHRIITDITDVIRFACDPRDEARFLRIYYKLGSPICKAAAVFACQRSARLGISIPEALAACPDSVGCGRQAAQELLTVLPQLPEQTGETALLQIWNTLNYQNYVARNKLDAGKFDILRMLARQEPDPVSLLDRLEALNRLIRSHRDPHQDAIILSTVHSSKGLEYGQVYLLDVLDGILPAKTPDAVRTPEELHQYEEERRLYYVAMTRAKDALYVFCCPDRPSQFTDELLACVPVPCLDPEDLFAGLSQDLCRRSYRHSIHGKGRVTAQEGERLLVAYPDGLWQLATVSQLLEQRDRTLRHDPAGPAALPALPNTPVQVGTPVHHKSFGTGVVLGISDGIADIRFDTDQRIRRILLDVTLRAGILRTQPPV